MGLVIVLALGIASVPAGAQEAGAGADAVTQDAAQKAGGGLRGLVPRVRLFCAPCFDEYAQEVWVRSLRWEGADDADTWTRRRGAMFVPPVPPLPQGSADWAPALLINGAAFDPVTVYVRHGDEWVNVAIALELPGRQALPTLPSYISVQQAPIPEEPRGEWGR